MALSTDTKLVIKTSALSALFTVILLVLLNYLINHTWALTGSSSSSKNPPITVQGAGSITATPDQSDITFTVTKTASTLQDAQNQANTFTNKIVGDLQKIGVAKNDIQTNNYNSYPNYNDNTPVVYNDAAQPNIAMPIRKPQTPAIISYTVTENVDISLHSADAANKVIDAITKDGAENISGPDLTFSEGKQERLENQARTLAIGNARQKAQNMADAAGIHLGKLSKISDDNQNPYPIVRPLMMNAAGTADKAAPTQINPGQNTVTASVTLTYETY